MSNPCFVLSQAQFSLSELLKDVGISGSGSLTNCIKGVYALQGLQKLREEYFALPLSCWVFSHVTTGYSFLAQRLLDSHGATGSRTLQLL